MLRRKTVFDRVATFGLGQILLPAPKIRHLVMLATIELNEQSSTGNIEVKTQLSVVLAFGKTRLFHKLYFQHLQDFADSLFTGRLNTIRATCSTQVAGHRLRERPVLWARDRDLRVHVHEILQLVVVAIRSMDGQNSLHKVPKWEPPFVANPRKGAFLTASAAQVSARLHAKWAVFWADDDDRDERAGIVQGRRIFSRRWRIGQWKRRLSEDGVELFF